MRTPDLYDLRDLHVVAMSKGGDPAFVDKFVAEFGTKYIDAPCMLVDDSGESPLLRAILNKRHDVAKKLIDHGASLYAPKKTGAIPWKEAITRGTDDLVEYMIAHGADVNMKYLPLGFTPLTVAAQSTSVKICKMLLAAGADVNMQDAMGNTALINAAAFGSEDVVAYLLRQGADTRPVNNKGQNALSFAPFNDNGNIYAMISAAAEVDRKKDIHEILKKPIGLDKDTEVFNKKIKLPKPRRPK